MVQIMPGVIQHICVVKYHVKFITNWEFGDDLPTDVGSTGSNTMGDRNVHFLGVGNSHDVFEEVSDNSHAVFTVRFTTVVSGVDRQ